MVHRVCGAIRLGEIDFVTDDCRPRRIEFGRGAYWRQTLRSFAAVCAGDGHGLPIVRALSAYERVRKSSIRVGESETAKVRDQGADQACSRYFKNFRSAVAATFPALRWPKSARCHRPRNR